MSCSPDAGPSKGAVVVVAAGRGTRFGGAKQWATVGGRPLVAHAAAALWRSGRVREMVLVVPPGEEARAQALVRAEGYRATVVVAGADSRQGSVARGLEALEPYAEGRSWVAVHDGARPSVTAELIGRLAAALSDADGAVPVMAVPDTLRWSDAPGGPDRSRIVAVGTPQLFREHALRRGHRAAAGGEATDDAALVEAAGGRIAQVPGDPAAFKVTWPSDLRRLDPSLWRRTAVGQGIDHHRVEAAPDGRVMLGGVEVARGHRLVGHSDGDAVLHAVANALRGAVGLADIGDAFPPGAPATRGIASSAIVAEAVARVRDVGGTVEQVQVTVVAGWPRVAPARAAMAAALAAMLDLPSERVAVHATSAEGLGDVGQGRAVEAHALVTVAFAR